MSPLAGPRRRSTGPNDSPGNVVAQRLSPTAPESSSAAPSLTGSPRKADVTRHLATVRSLGPGLERRSGSGFAAQEAALAPGGLAERDRRPTDAVACKRHPGSRRRLRRSRPRHHTSPRSVLLARCHRRRHPRPRLRPARAILPPRRASHPLDPRGAASRSARRDALPRRQAPARRLIDLHSQHEGPRSVLGWVTGQPPPLSDPRSAHRPAYQLVRGCPGFATGHGLTTAPKALRIQSVPRSPPWRPPVGPTDLPSRQYRAATSRLLRLSRARRSIVTARASAASSKNVVARAHTETAATRHASVTADRRRVSTQRPDFQHPARLHDHRARFRDHHAGLS